MQGVAHNHCGVIVTVLSNRRQGAGVRGILGYVSCAVFRFSLEGHKRKFYTRVQLVSRLFSDRKRNNHNTTIVAHSRSRLPVQFYLCLCTFHRIVLSYTVCKSLSLCSHNLTYMYPVQLTRQIKIQYTTRSPLSIIKMSVTEKTGELCSSY